MGELHLEIIVDRLRREYGAEASVGTPQVVYRETVQAEAEGRATFERELKEATLFGEARCRVAPRSRGAGLLIQARLPSTPEQPPHLVEAALAGLTEAAQSGPDGFPLEDLEATLLEIAYRDEAQPEVGLKVASGQAFRQAVLAASPLRLEPVMALEVVLPEEALGAVISDLRQRRAQIVEIVARGATHLLRAEVPLRLVFGYSTALRSLTKGRATFSMHFAHYGHFEGTATV
jgi:elongation factor G